MRAYYADIRKALEARIKDVPVLPASPDWRQSGWSPSMDGGLYDASATSATVWTKVVQTRFNGWDGESFHVRASFTDAETPEQVADRLADNFRAIIARRIER